MLIERLPELWSEANEEEPRRLPLMMLDNVYVDTKEEKRVVAVRPKAPSKAVFQVATTRAGSGVALVHDRQSETPAADQSLRRMCMRLTPLRVRGGDGEGACLTMVVGIR